MSMCLHWVNPQKRKTSGTKNQFLSPDSLLEKARKLIPSQEKLYQPPRKGFFFPSSSTSSVQSVTSNQSLPIARCGPSIVIIAQNANSSSPTSPSLASIIFIDSSNKIVSYRQKLKKIIKACRPFRHCRTGQKVASTKQKQKSKSSSSSSSFSPVHQHCILISVLLNLMYI